MARIEVTVRLNPIFDEANITRKRYRVLKGSAGSGKSVDIATDYIIKLQDKTYQGANLLVVRKAESSNRYSTFAELQSAIMRIHGNSWDRFWKINTSHLMIQSRVTGNSIIFRGANDQKQREKLKSIQFPRGKLTWIWVEEGTELQESDVDILDDRLRGELINPNLYYQMTLTFNPVSALHWIKRKYFDYVSSDIFTHHSTYLDNIFIDEAYHRRMMMRKEQDPEGYKVYGLGEWGQTSGLILSKWKSEDFDNSSHSFDSFVYAQDFGFNHANAILGVGFRGRDMYVCDEIYKFDTETPEVIAAANSYGIDKKRIMYCDSENPDAITQWQKAGYKNAIGVTKGPGSVMSQIDYLKQQRIIIHPSCVNTIKEISQWSWKFDQKRGIYLDAPVEFMDDAMACLRYAVEGHRNPPAKAWKGHVNY